MADLKFVYQHNMVACLEKSDKNSEFHHIVDFLSTCSINYALTVSPTIYASYIEQFWNTATSKIVNFVKQIHAKVNGKAVVISESSVRNDLLFDDEDGITCLTNDEIFENLTLMGMVRAITTDASLDAAQDSDIISKTQSMATLTEPTPQDEGSGSGLGRQDTIWGAQAQTRSEGVPIQAKEPPLSTVNTVGSGEARGYTPGSDEGRLKLEELMNICTILSKQVLDLEKEKDAQAMEILRLKKRVKRLERKRKSSTSQSRKRLYKKVLYSNNDLDEEDASKQGRTRDKTEPMFKESDFDDIDNLVDEGMAFVQEKDVETVDAATTRVSTVSAPVTTAGVTISTADPIINLDEVEGRESKGKGVAFKDVEEAPRLHRSTTTLKPLPTIDPKDKGKGILIEEESVKVKRKYKGLAQMKSDEELAYRLHEEELAKIERIQKERQAQEEASKAAIAEMFDEVQAGIDADALFAAKLQHEDREEYTIKERAKFLAETIAAQRKFRAAQRAAKIRSRPPTKTQLRNLMMTYLKNMGGYKHYQLKGKTFDEIQGLYERQKKMIDDFKPMDSDGKEKETEKKDDRSSKPAGSTRKKSLSKKRAGEKQIEESTKRQKLDEDAAADYEQEKEKLRAWLIVFQDEEETVDIEILSAKFLIVDWDSQTLGSTDMEEYHVYKIIRADGNISYHKSLYSMLRKFDRQDLVHLHRLAMKRFEDTTPEEDEIWSNQHNWRLISWKLHDNYGVHSLLLDGTLTNFNMLVEKRYPLTKEMLQKMLNWRLEAEAESTMALELLKYIKSQVQEHQISVNNKTGVGFDNQMNENELHDSHMNKSEVFESASDSSVNESEEDNNQVNARYKAGKGYHAVPPPYTGNYMPPRPDMSFAGLDDSVFKSTVSETVTSVHETETSASKTSKERMEEPKTVRSSAPLIEEWESDSDDDCVIRPSFEQNKPRKSVLNNEGKATGQREVRPVWNNAQRVNHQNISNNLTHPHPRRNFVPSVVITNSGKVPVNTAKQSFPKAAVSNSTARYVNTATSRPTVNGAKPSSNVFHKSHSPARRTFNQRAAPKNSILKEKVNTAKVNNVTIVGPKAVVSAVQGNRENIVKSSAGWIWRPKQNLLDHGNPQHDLKDQGIVDSGCSRHMTGNKACLLDYQEVDGGFVVVGGRSKGGKINGKGKIRTEKLYFEDVYFVKELKFNLFSVSQMCNKKNNVLFTETECVILSPDFKLLDESQVLLKVPRHNNIYNFDLKNVVPSGGLTCLFEKATIDESNLWHMRLGHINIKNMNKLVRRNLVRDFPSKLFVNDHTCVACQKGKQHKASCKTKLVSSISQPLQMLHMDLFGPTFVKSLNKKMYCLVVTDDFSRLSWVFFLASKDETSGILKTFITGIENQINHRVKIIRCDNGTEFKNSEMNQFCQMKGIEREFWLHFLNFFNDPRIIWEQRIAAYKGYRGGGLVQIGMKDTSVARTPQQNGVAERKNRTLIEAARTMLAYSLLPTTFWAEAINTACYIQNRVLITKPHNKTPYELLIGRPPNLDFMRHFRCPVTILNTLDHLGKFEGKANEGFLVGYSINSKAFRVFNTRTRKVEENLHIKFLENKSNVAGSGLEWLFDIDSLTKSMNYEPVTTGSQTNGDAGIETNVNAGQAGQEKAFDHEYILLLFMPSNLSSTQSSDDKDADEVPGKGDDGVYQGSGIDDQERTDSSTKDVNTARPSINTANANINTGSPNINTASPIPNDPNMTTLEETGIFDGSYDDEDVGVEADLNNLETTMHVSPIPTTRIHKDHPLEQIIRDLHSTPLTRRMSQQNLEELGLVTFINKQSRTKHKDYQNCLFACFLSQKEPKKVIQALTDPSWIEAMVDVQAIPLLGLYYEINLLIRNE
ncbi:putative ribonuclease H-like domain-containing protein [Tanacetum coccineum]